MAKSDVLENAILDIIYTAVAMADMFENDGSTPATNISVALHTADPGDAGTQLTSEVRYAGYARVNVVRTTGGWTVTGPSVSPGAAITFPASTDGPFTVTHFSTGTGAGNVMLHHGTVTPNITVNDGVTPELTTATAITES